jgi:putative ABC transport system substrate-binding protein
MVTDIQRRKFITLLGGAAAWPLGARAQQGERMRRIGVFMGIAEDSQGRARVAAFQHALQALGWTEGRNIQFNYRWSFGDAAQARRFADELIDMRLDLILANSTPVSVALKNATRTTPIVFVQVADPIGSQLVQSLARPGSHLTGFTNFEPSMAGKWIELLKGVSPSIKRIAYLFNPKTAPPVFARSIESMAPLLSIELLPVAVDGTIHDGAYD